MNRYLVALEELWSEHLRPRRPDAPTVVSLFAGAGGSSFGYGAAGFNERLAIDQDKLAAVTFSLNFPGVPMWCENIKRLSAEDVLLATGLRCGELDVLDSSPPCQCFSRTRTRRLRGFDARTELWREVDRLLRGLQPKCFLMENVTGLAEWRWTPILDEMLQAFRAAGYRVATRELLASDFAVPQDRRRIIIIGMRRDLEIPPSFPAPDPPEALRPTVREAFDGLPTWQPRPTPLGQFAEIAPRIPQGCDGGDVHPDHHYFNSHRLAWDAPAKTILASQLPHNVLTLHPDLDRGCSIREAMRLQSFPDNFAFVGTHQERWRMIGNAVPPLLMWRLAAHLAGVLKGAAGTRSDKVNLKAHTQIVLADRRPGRFGDGLTRLKFEIFTGDVGGILGRLPVVNCVVTSPPYYRKRRYGSNATVELGWETTVDEYVGNLCNVFAAINLHPRGSLWVNLGDTRDAGGGWRLVPEQFACEMVKRGWHLVDRVIWAKQVAHIDGTTDGACMPEPHPRLNGNCFEFLFRFTRCRPGEAWTDMHAVALPRQENQQYQTQPRYLPPELMEVMTVIEGRGIGAVWRLPVGWSQSEHAATYSTALVERPIAMSCPMWTDGGVPRDRIVEMRTYSEGTTSPRKFGKRKITSDQAGRNDHLRCYVARKPVTVGWTPISDDWQPGIVLDPFAGSGTTGATALRMGRSFVGVDLYENFASQCRRRCRETVDWMAAKGLNPFEFVHGCCAEPAVDAASV